MKGRSPSAEQKRYHDLLAQRIGCIACQKDGRFNPSVSIHHVDGRTKHSYAHTGHLHHRVVRETNTMCLEQHRTMAAPDSHASRGGWMSGRDAQVITYHSEYGEVGRNTVSADMLRGEAA